MTDKLYMRHIRACRYCKDGFKIFCEARSLDYRKFLKDGIKIKDLKKLMGNEKHTLVERAIKLAQNEKENKV